MEQLDEAGPVRAATQAVAAVHGDGLAGDPARLVRREEQHGVGDVLGLADVAERRLIDVAVPDRTAPLDTLEDLAAAERELASRAAGRES